MIFSCSAWARSSADMAAAVMVSVVIGVSPDDGCGLYRLDTEATHGRNVDERRSGCTRVRRVTDPRVAPDGPPTIRGTQRSGGRRRRLQAGVHEQLREPVGEPGAVLGRQLGPGVLELGDPAGGRGPRGLVCRSGPSTAGGPLRGYRGYSMGHDHTWGGGSGRCHSAIAATRASSLGRSNSEVGTAFPTRGCPLPIHHCHSMYPSLG